MDNKRRSGGFTLTTACAAIGFPDNNVRSWIKRGVINLPERPEGGGWRRLDVPDVLMLAIAVQLSAYCMPVKDAWWAVETINEKYFDQLRKYEKAPDQAYLAVLISRWLFAWQDETGWQWAIKNDTSITYSMPPSVVVTDLHKLAQSVLERLDNA